jgi:hypothetical protein
MEVGQGPSWGCSAKGEKIFQIKVAFPNYIDILGCVSIYHTSSLSFYETDKTRPQYNVMYVLY